jgi:hypothetical protein
MGYGELADGISHHIAKAVYGSWADKMLDHVAAAYRRASHWEDLDRFRAVAPSSRSRRVEPLRYLLDSGTKPAIRGWAVPTLWHKNAAARECE